MDNKERRRRIAEILAGAKAPENATKLAERFGVTRQIIVSDVAILRAMGHPIVSEKRGYYLEKPEPNGYIDTVVCKHSPERTAEEFYAVTDHGGRVLDVTVDHPIYGQISVNLNIGSRYEADCFVRQAKESNASLLCDLTGGVHIHTLAMPDAAAYARTVERLRELGILLE